MFTFIHSSKLLNTPSFDSVQLVRNNGSNYWNLSRAKANQGPVMSEANILKMAQGYWAADLKVKYLEEWVDRYPDSTTKSLQSLLKRRGLLTNEAVK